MSIFCCGASSVQTPISDVDYLLEKGKHLNLKCEDPKIQKLIARGRIFAVLYSVADGSKINASVEKLTPDSWKSFMESKKESDIINLYAFKDSTKRFSKSTVEIDGKPFDPPVTDSAVVINLTSDVESVHTENETKQE